MDKFLDRVKDIFARVTRSDTVQKSVSTAKETAAGVGATASKVAGDAAGKARFTATNLGAKARETASDLSDKTAQLADSAADKAKDTASDLSGKTAQLADAAALKARETASGLSSRSDQSAPQAVTMGAAAAGSGSQAAPEERGGLSEAAQTTIDESSEQADAFVREAAVELDAAPANLPGDAVDAVSDAEVGVEASAVDVDDAVRRSKSDSHQE